MKEQIASIGKGVLNFGSFAGNLLINIVTSGANPFPAISTVLSKIPAKIKGEVNDIASSDKQDIIFQGLLAGIIGSIVLMIRKDKKHRTEQHEQQYCFGENINLIGSFFRNSTHHTHKKVPVSSKKNPNMLKSNVTYFKNSKEIKDKVANLIYDNKSLTEYIQTINQNKKGNTAISKQEKLAEITNNMIYKAMNLNYLKEDYPWKHSMYTDSLNNNIYCLKESYDQGFRFSQSVVAIIKEIQPNNKETLNCILQSPDALESFNNLYELACRRPYKLSFDNIMNLHYLAQAVNHSKIFGKAEIKECERIIGRFNKISELIKKNNPPHVKQNFKSKNKNKTSWKSKFSNIIPNPLSKLINALSRLFVGFTGIIFSPIYYVLRKISSFMYILRGQIGWKSFDLSLGFANLLGFGNLSDIIINYEITKKVHQFKSKYKASKYKFTTNEEKIIKEKFPVFDDFLKGKVFAALEEYFKDRYLKHHCWQYFKNNGYRIDNHSEVLLYFVNKVNDYEGEIKYKLEKGIISLLKSLKKKDLENLKDPENNAIVHLLIKSKQFDIVAKILEDPKVNQNDRNNKSGNNKYNEEFHNIISSQNNSGQTPFMLGLKYDTECKVLPLIYDAIDSCKFDKNGTGVIEYASQSVAHKPLIFLAKKIVEARGLYKYVDNNITYSSTKNKNSVANHKITISPQQVEKINALIRTNFSDDQKKKLVSSNKVFGTAIQRLKYHLENNPEVKMVK